MRIAAGSIVIFGALLAAGCGAGGERQTYPVVTEIDGILHVQLPSQLPADVPPWRLREVFNTTSSGSALELFRVTAARFLDDGTVAIANSGTSEILVLGADGTLRRRFGRAGSGPGEFRSLTALHLDSTGSLLAYDPRAVRLTRLTPAGDVVETRRLSSENAVVDLYPLTELADGRILAVFGDRRAFRPTGEARDTIPLIAVDPATATWDTLGTWPAQEWAFLEFSQGITRTEVGFGRTLAYAGSRGRAVVASTDSIDLTIFDSAGDPAMRIAGWGSYEAVPAADVERWRNDLLERRSRAPEEIRRWLESAPRRDTYPAFRNLLLDDDGRVWIGMYPAPGQPQSWLIIGAEGRLEGLLTIPGEATLLDAARERLLILRRTELDEEYIVVMAIERDG
jgi:hypothetical protein